MNMPGNGKGNGNGTPWWAKLPTGKLVVVGSFGFAFKYGDALIDGLLVRLCG